MGMCIISNFHATALHAPRRMHLFRYAGFQFLATLNESYMEN